MMATPPKGLSMSTEDRHKAGNTAADARSVYVEFVAEATKLGEIYVEVARKAYAPLRTAFAEPYASI